MQRPDRKWSGGAFARYTVNEHFEAYAEIMFMDDYTDAQIAPTGSWGAAPVINCDNPMLSDQQRQIMCTDRGLGPDDVTSGDDTTILRRNGAGDVLGEGEREDLEKKVARLERREQLLTELIEEREDKG